MLKSGVCIAGVLIEENEELEVVADAASADAIEAQASSLLPSAAAEYTEMGRTDPPMSSQLDDAACMSQIRHPARAPGPAAAGAAAARAHIVWGAESQPESYNFSDAGVVPRALAPRSEGESDYYAAD